jgi:hypothetical protein
MTGARPRLTIAALIAGVLYAYDFGSVSVDNYDPFTALSLIAFAYAGGITLISGVVFAGLISVQALFPYALWRHPPPAGRPGPVHAPHRARHGPGPGHLRPRGGAGIRQGNRRGHSRGSPPQPPRSSRPTWATAWSRPPRARRRNPRRSKPRVKARIIPNDRCLLRSPALLDPVAEARVLGHLPRHARSASRPRVRHLSTCAQPNFDVLAIGNDDPLMWLICAMQCQ